MPDLETFADIQNHWAQSCIEVLVQKAIINGYPDRTFRPEGSITRAEFANLLLKAFPQLPAVTQVPDFKDVSENHWAYPAIKFVAERKLFVGYPDGTFQPDIPLLRVQAIGILVNRFDYKLAAPANNTLPKYYDDANEIPNYAKASIAIATENLLVVNYPNIRKLRPNQKATRGEVAALLCQALRIPDTVPPQYIPWCEFLTIPRQFDGATSFSEGVAWVKIGKKWGAIDRTGKLIIEPEYYDFYPFYSGLALVKIGGKFRYLDKTGKIAIALDLEEASPFAEGLAVVKVGGKFGYLNPQGQFAIKPQFEAADRFSEGLAAVKIQTKAGIKAGFINKTGQFVIQPKYDWALTFSNGAAWVAGPGLDLTFIDKLGKETSVTLPSQLKDMTGNFSEGLARVSIQEGDGFIDKTGKLAIPAKYQWASPFSEGLASVSLDSKCGFIDKTGKLVIPLEFDWADSFYEGLARVKVGEKLGYIDREGNFAIAPQFLQAHNFSQGLVAIDLGDSLQTSQWGYLQHPLK